MLSIKDEAAKWNQTRRISSALTIVADSWKTVSTREREKEREGTVDHAPNISSQCSSFDCSYPRRPPSQKIAPQIRLSFHTRISTPICHACIEATYLYTSLRIVIMERTAPPPKLHHSRKWSISRKVSSFRRGISHRVYAYPLIRCAWRKSIYIFSLFFISFHERFDHWIPFTSLQSQSSSNWL